MYQAMKTFHWVEQVHVEIRVYHEVFLHRAFDFLSLEIQPEASSLSANFQAGSGSGAQLPYNSSASFFLNMAHSREDRSIAVFSPPLFFQSRLTRFYKSLFHGLYLYLLRALNLSLSLSLFPCLEKNSIARRLNDQIKPSLYLSSNYLFTSKLRTLRGGDIWDRDK